jgi:hypothetical protein
MIDDHVGPFSIQTLSHFEALESVLLIFFLVYVNIDTLQIVSKNMVVAKNSGSAEENFAIANFLPVLSSSCSRLTIL